MPRQENLVERRRMILGYGCSEARSAQYQLALMQRSRELS